MKVIFGSMKYVERVTDGMNNITNNVVEFHVQATGARDEDGLIRALSGSGVSLSSVLDSSQVHSRDRYMSHLKSFGDNDYIVDDRILLFFDEFISLAELAGVDIEVVMCNYDDSAIGRNALKLRNSVVKSYQGEVVDKTVKTSRPPKKATNVEKVKDNIE